MWVSSFFLTLLYIYHVNGDCYIQNPRGSNNRLNGKKRERDTDDRLFDSQNNNRGGYNVGGDEDRETKLNAIFGITKKIKGRPGIRAETEERVGPPGKMKYYEGSIMQVSWTNQHQCGGANANCELVLQYMCSDNLRDGILDRRIPEVNQCERSEVGSLNNCTTDRRYGMHENTDYYIYCKNRKRNKGLYTADQNLNNKETAIYTRQNNDGNRNGYECPEERDYYPYWAPTPWIDIAVMTNNVSRCEYYKTKSENVEPRWYCKIPPTTLDKLRVKNANGGANDRIPINQAECEAKSFDGGVKGQWVQDTRDIHPPPECIFSPKSRDNHNGNGPTGFQNSYNWTLPNTPHKNCALRLRYNISTADYDWSVDSSSNGAGTLDIGANIGENNDEAKSRGFEFKGNPTIKPLKIDGTDIGDRLKLNLAIATNQFGRTFQDRTHAFSILERSQELVGKKIYNMAVQGKRGNIVQTFPATEYDYMPNRLEVKKDDYVHIQWTGSDKNPQNNAGNGKAGSDRSNMVLLKGQIYPEGTPEFAVSDELKNGHWGRSYPENLDSPKTLLGLPRDDRQYLALTVSEGHQIIPINADNVKASKIIYKFPYLPPVYNVTFSLKLTEDGGNRWTSVLHFTEGLYGSWVKNKGVIPAVFLHRNKLRIYTNGGRRGSYKRFDYPNFPLNTFVDIRVEYSTVGNKYIHKTYIGGNLVKTVETSNIPEYDTVYVYAADRYYTPFKGEIRDLTVQFYSTPKGNLKDLDDAHPYFDLGPRKMTKLGEYKYMCTRNNAFTNRSQKGMISVVEEAAAGDTPTIDDVAKEAADELMDIDKLFAQTVVAA